MADSTYPSRPKFFALKAVRAMVKTCVANEYGQGVFCLLVTIVHTEDAAHYRRPVTFYEGQLMPLIGIMSRTTFHRVRQRAIESGWLVCIQGQRGRPPSYFVTIPKHASSLDDNPTDEGDEFENDDEHAPNGAQNLDIKRAQFETEDHLSSVSRPNFGHQTELNRAQRGTGSGATRDESGTETGLKRSAYKPSPIPNPVPNPVPPPTPSGGVGDDLAMFPEVVQPEGELVSLTVDATLNDLIATWNGLEGVNAFTREAADLTYLQRSKVRLWVTGRKKFDWQAALRKFPLRCFSGAGEFRPTLGWFLKDDNAAEVLEGKFDWKKGSKPKPDFGGAVYSGERPAAVGEM
jgi:hypothetical protein